MAGDATMVSDMATWQPGVGPRGDRAFGRFGYASEVMVVLGVASL
jgi:hypothetical protein